MLASCVNVNKPSATEVFKIKLQCAYKEYFSLSTILVVRFEGLNVEKYAGSINMVILAIRKLSNRLRKTICRL
jgi:hypothetical protein